MSETDISTAAVDRRRVYIDRDKVFSPGNTWAIVAGLYPHGYVQEESYLAMTADRDRLQRENETLREVEGYIQAAREYRQANGERANISTVSIEQLIGFFIQMNDTGYEDRFNKVFIAQISALLADRDRLQRENDNLRQIERNVQAVREREHQRANAAEADRDQLAAEVARLTGALRVEREAADVLAWRLHAAMLDVNGWRIGAMDLIAAHAARREGEA